MTTRELRKIASEMGRPAIIKALRKKAAQMSKEKGKERTVELAEEFIALTDGKLAVVYDVSVDLHRNLTQ